MQISIKKNNGDYSLTIKSGHFNGTLDKIPEETIQSLKNSLDEILGQQTGHTETIVWNPRAQRHERI